MSLKYPLKCPDSHMFGHVQQGPHRHKINSKDLTTFKMQQTLCFYVLNLMKHNKARTNVLFVQYPLKLLFSGNLQNISNPFHQVGQLAKF